MLFRSTGFTFPPCSAPAFVSGTSYIGGSQVSFGGYVALITPTIIKPVDLDLDRYIWQVGTKSIFRVLIMNLHRQITMLLLSQSAITVVNGAQVGTNTPHIVP